MTKIVRPIAVDKKCQEFPAGITIALRGTLAAWIDADKRCKT
jgi:hypothetical protein